MGLRMTAGCLPVYGPRRHSPPLSETTETRDDNRIDASGRACTSGRKRCLFFPFVSTFNAVECWERERERERERQKIVESLFRVERTSSTVFFPIPSFVLLSFPVCLCVYYLNSKSREDFVTLNYGGGGGKNRGWHFRWVTIKIPLVHGVFHVTCYLNSHLSNQWRPFPLPNSIWQKCK